MSTSKLPEDITLWPLTYNAIQSVSINSYLPRLITYAPSFMLGKLFLE